jgi:hypothetical protein
MSREIVWGENAAFIIALATPWTTPLRQGGGGVVIVVRTEVIETTTTPPPLSGEWGEVRGVSV